MAEIFFFRKSTQCSRTRFRLIAVRELRRVSLGFLISPYDSITTRGVTRNVKQKPNITGRMPTRSIVVSVMRSVDRTSFEMVPNQLRITFNLRNYTLQTLAPSRNTRHAFRMLTSGRFPAGESEYIYIYIYILMSVHAWCAINHAWMNVCVPRHCHCMHSIVPWNL